MMTSSKPQMHLIVIVPPKDIQRQVSAFKNEMKVRFNAKHALKLPAHITLQRPFWVPAIQRDRLYRELKDFAGLQHIVTIALRGFNCFSPRVIFVDVETPAPLIKIQRELQCALSEIVFLRQKERQRSPIRPHVTIATRDLNKESFYPAWEAFRDRDYLADFKATAIVLFRHDGKHWHQIKEYPFLKEERGKTPNHQF